jgi:mycothiol synthase
MTVQIRQFDPKSATQADWEAITDLTNLRSSIILPDDPQYSVETVKKNWLSTPPVVSEYHWFAWTSAGELVGRGEVDFINMEENKHMAQVFLFVDPDWRRQGIGSQLLALMNQKAQEGGRRMLLGSVYERDDSGQAFSKTIGAEVGLATHTNQLKIEDADRALIQKWIDRSQERASGYTLEFWDGPYPEEDLEKAAVMVGAMNQAPTGDLDIEDFQYTPELFRQIEATFAAQGVERWTYVAREKATGDLVGYTDIIWQPTKPNIGMINSTGVLEQHQNQGLGRWLKAAMMQKILTEKPNVTLIRTGNADMNEPMLKINNQLGFKPYQANSVVQVSLDKVAEYLNTRNI